MAFITKQDMYTHINEENIDIIDWDTDEAMTKAIAGGIAEAQSYMSKYDIDSMFAKTGDQRDPILLMQTGNLIAFHFIGLSNAGVDYAVIEDRYTKASAWFTKVESNKSTPYGWPLKPIDPITGANPAGTIKYGSNQKRKNHY